MFDGGLHRIGGGRPVEINGRFSGEGDGKVGNRAAERGGHVDADTLLLFDLRLKPVGERNGSGEEFAIGRLGAERVAGDRAEPVAAGLFQEFVAKRLSGAVRFFGGMFRAQLGDHTADFIGGRVGGNWFSKTDGDGIGELEWEF